MGKRRRSRELAIKVLYHLEFSNDDPNAAFYLVCDHFGGSEEIKDFAKRAIDAIDQQFKAMDDYLGTLDKSSMLYKTDSLFIKHDKMLLTAEKEWIRDAVKNLSMLQSISN